MEQFVYALQAPVFATALLYPSPPPVPSPSRHAPVDLTPSLRYIEGDITPSERVAWESNFETVPEALTAEDKDAFLSELKGVSLSSDAFFPFRDSIDHASKARENFLSFAKVCLPLSLAVWGPLGILPYQSPV